MIGNPRRVKFQSLELPPRRFGGNAGVGPFAHFDGVTAGGDAEGVGELGLPAGLLPRGDVLDAAGAAGEQQRFGLPAAPRQILMPGRWHQGYSTR